MTTRLRLLQLPITGPITRSRTLIVIDRAEDIDFSSVKMPDGINVIVFDGEVQIGEDWEQRFDHLPQQLVLPDADMLGEVDGTGTLQMSNTDLRAHLAGVAEPLRAEDSGPDHS